MAKVGRPEKEMSENVGKLRKDKEANIEAITRFQREFIVKNKHFPTYKQIAEGTGLSTKTIERRAKDIDFHKVAETHTSKFGLYSLIQSLYQNAAKGNIKALDRYVQYTFGIIPEQKIELKGGLEITINKKITSENPNE